MKFVIYSVHGDGIALAPRLMAEGNEVALYLERGKRSYENAGIRRLDTFTVPDGAIAVFDMVGKGQLADDLRARGTPVVGSGVFGDRLELDRGFGARVMQAVGIKTPPTRIFDRFSDGIAAAETSKTGLFFKPHGNKPTAMTYGDDDPKLVAKMMRYFERKWQGPVKFELQEMVGGIELSVEGWFDGHDWLLPFNSTFEDKKMMAGDLGPNTGCTSSTVWAWQHMRPKVVRETLLKMTRLLRKAGYVGPLDLNTKGGFGLEWTARFGYSALYALVELLQVDVGKLLSDVAHGQARKMPVSRDFAFALRLFVPPEKDGSFPAGLPVEGVKFGERHVWPLDVKVDDEGDIVTAGVDGAVCEVTGAGRTIEDAQRKVFQRASGITVPNLFYRIDAGTRARKQIKEVLDTYVSG